MTDAVAEQAPTRPRLLATALGAGAAVGVLGGMIGLGGAEFRLPLLIGVFGFVALQAVILNKAMSLVVVAHRAARPAGRRPAVGPAPRTGRRGQPARRKPRSGPGSGATWATRMRSATLYKVLAALLVLIAAALAVNHLGTIEPLGARHCPPAHRRRGRWPGSASASSRRSWASPAASC